MGDSLILEAQAVLAAQIIFYLNGQTEWLYLIKTGLISEQYFCMVNMSPEGSEHMSQN